MTVTTSARITALDAITASTIVSSDVFVVVDISDTAMAATGTDYKIRADELASTVALQMGASTLPVSALNGFPEAVQDVMGVALQSTSTIGFLYTDGSNKEEAFLNIDVYSIVQAVDNVTSTNYTLVLADAGHLKLLNTTTAGVVRLPLNASVALPIGTHIDFQQTNVGQYTFTTQAGVTIVANPAAPKTTTSAMASVVKTAADTWGVGGYLV